jgi:hypothetical protein
MSVSNWLTMRRSTSPPALSRAGAIESISSIKIMAGAFFGFFEDFAQVVFRLARQLGHDYIYI